MEGSAFELTLVVDTLTSETSSGGVRIAPDVTEEEVRTLAREMSYKYSFFLLPRGGAKLGISLRCREGERSETLREVGRRLGPVIRKGLYYPGMDMGCSEEDLRRIYAGAGIGVGAVTDTSFFTALSVRDTLLPATAHLGGNSSRPLTLAVAGLGRVATHLLRLLPEGAFRVVAFSTVEGGRYIEEGMSCAELAEERTRHGDAVVKHVARGKAIPAREVLGVSADILVPSARTRDIEVGNEESVRARAIVPIANAPVSEEAAKKLAARGVLCLPGFVANAGGVYASGLFDRGVPIPEIDALCARHHRRVVDALLAAASSSGTAPDVLARRLAEEHLQAAEREEGPPPASGIVQALKARFRRGPSPEAVRRDFTSRMERLVGELERKAPA